MVATSDLVVTLWQFIRPGSLSKTWEQMLVILAVLWFSAALSSLRLRITQSYANVVVFFYGGAIFLIGLAGVLWLIGGNKSANSFSGVHNWVPHGSNWTFFGLVILALLGIEVPLNMGVEIVHMRAIKKYLFWGSIVVMIGYLWATFGTMMNLPASQSTGGLSDIFVAVQHAFWGSHAWAVIIALIALWFFVSNTVVYNYSFSRLLFVSGLERRMPAALGRVDERTRVPVNAIIVQTVRQPPITREITMGDVVLGAVGFVGVVMITAAIAGLLVGVVVVLMKRSRDRAAGPTDPGHSRLRV